MTPTNRSETTPQRPLRLWPGVVLAIFQPVGWFVMPRLFPEQDIYWVLSAVAAGLLILLWWAFFSRAPYPERWGALLLMVIATFVTSRFLHISVAQAGMGMMFYFYSATLLTFVLVASVVASARLATATRRAVLAAMILLATGGWALVRIDGIGGLGTDFAWRWSPTAEERLLAQAAAEPPLPAPPPTPAAPPEPVGAEAVKQPAAKTPSEKRAGPTPTVAPATKPAEWPGFRGPQRDSIIGDVRIGTDWSASPPVQLWQRAVGPGWSSFAVDGDMIFTQEQRGEEEIVATYNLKTGQPVWRHRDKTRFWEANAGAGPRATPTLSGGRVYTLGATGIVNALDAATGAVVWSRNSATDTGAKLPYWGFSGSPLVVGDLVIVAASGSLVAYDIATGNPRWFGPKGGESYSSPHLANIGGVAQVLILSVQGVTSVALSDGKTLWQHEWKGYPIVQPAMTADGDVLISVSQDSGTRRLAVKREGETWTVQERWTSRALKPYFNDFVVHKGHAYGFDNNILACIELENGQRKWKGGRYGNGQLVLLPAQDLLLVLTEEGELALVSATTERFTEVARVAAIEGKTWNHPVLVGDTLLVRNDQHMAAFRLSRLSAANTVP